MKATVYYILYPLFFLISRLPFKALLVLSDGLYYIIKWSGYRKKVIKKNLTNSFPAKSSEQINQMVDGFYQYFCDLIVEVIKGLSMTESEVKKHCVFHMEPWLEALYNNGKSILVVMGHYGNWEWAGPGFGLVNKHQLVVVYKPLSNIHFEKMMYGVRTKFKTEIVPVNQTLRKMVENRNRITATAFIADQTAAPESAYWTSFLHQPTAVYNGPERLTKKFDYPVVFMNVKRVRRGYYEVFPELLSAEPKTTLDNEISELFIRRLEEEIVKDPIPWLWSHRRWKHEQPKI